MGQTKEVGASEAPTQGCAHPERAFLAVVALPRPHGHRRRVGTLAIHLDKRITNPDCRDSLKNLSAVLTTGTNMLD